MATKKKHQELLRKYAEAVVKVGLNLRPGQRLIMTNATARGVPPPARPFVHEVAKAAYAAGARYVDIIWGDEEMMRIRLQYAPADSLSDYPKWHVNGIMNMINHYQPVPPDPAHDPPVHFPSHPAGVAAMQKAH